MSKTRDDKGRFITEIREDAESVYSICMVIYKMIPLTMIALIAIKYFNFSRIWHEAFLIIGCGNSNCKCLCDNGTDQGDFKSDV